MMRRLNLRVHRNPSDSASFIVRLRENHEGTLPFDQGRHSRWNILLRRHGNREAHQPRQGQQRCRQQIVAAKNQAQRQPLLNLQIAKAYLAETDSGVATRTWHHALEALTNGKQGANRERWLRVAKEKALVVPFPKVIIETQGELLLKVLQAGLFQQTLIFGDSTISVCITGSTGGGQSRICSQLHSGACSL
jgi:hypothetical protein